MNVADEFEDISMEDLVAVPETLRPPARLNEDQVALNDATALAETTSNDQATGSTRLQTPPPNQRVFAASNPPSRSSQESMIVATQNTTLSPTKALQRAAKSIEFDSPDPLRLVPVPSAASSAARSRSRSVEPPCSHLRSSPSSRASARPRSSRTPATRDHFGENDPSGSDEIIALGPTPTRTHAPRPPAVADDLSEDELTMTPIRDSTHQRQSAGKKVYPGKKKSTRTERDSKIVTGQENGDSLAAVPTGSPSLEHALSEGDFSRDPVQADRPSFVIDEPAGSVRVGVACLKSVNTCADDDLAAYASPLVRLAGSLVFTFFTSSCSWGSYSRAHQRQREARRILAPLVANNLPRRPRTAFLASHFSSSYTCESQAGQAGLLAAAAVSGVQTQTKPRAPSDSHGAERSILRRRRCDHVEYNLESVAEEEGEVPRAKSKSSRGRIVQRRGRSVTARESSNDAWKGRQAHPNEIRSLGTSQKCG